MGSTEGRKAIWTGAVFLTAAAFIGKILSALYRVPYQNITGDLGYYVYQQVYPFYGAAMVVSMYGFPVLISKLVLEKEKEAGRKAAQETAWSAFFILLVIHIVLFTVFVGGAEFIAGWMGDLRLVVPLRTIGCVFLFIPFYSAIRGYFQGINNMSPTAVSHLIEQFIRVTAIISLAWIAIHSGKDAYAAGEAAALGSLLGAGAGILYLILLVWRKGILTCSINWKRVWTGVKVNIKKVAMQGLLLCIGSMVFILYQFVDAFSIAKLLEKAGMAAQNAREMKGLFDRGQPLLQFGTVIAASMAMTVVPLISREEKQQNKEKSTMYAGLAVRVSILIGCAAAAGLLIIAESVNIFLYENNEGTSILRILALTLAASGPVMVTSGVMQGHDCFVRPAVHLFVGWGVKLAGNIVLLPLFGIHGAAAATILGMLVTAGCNFLYLWYKNWLYPPTSEWLIKAVSALAGMVAAAGLLQYIFSAYFSANRLAAAGSAVGISVVSAVLFAWLIVQLNVFTRSESSLLPGMEKLEGVLKRKEKRWD